jgi:acetylornithine aminotransferase/acetylornithine/N-succinyldiaminopimelate aminotransferase
VEKLEGVAARYPHLATGVRGRGLLLGLLLTEKGIEQGGAIVQSLFEQGALINFAGNRVLRFVPPLVVSCEEIDQLVEKLCRVFDQIA